MAKISNMPAGRTTGANHKFYLTSTKPTHASGLPKSTEILSADLIAKMTEWDAPAQSAQSADQSFYGQDVGESYPGAPTWEPARVTVQIDHDNSQHQRMIGLDDSASYSLGDDLYLYVVTAKSGKTVVRAYKVQWSGFSESMPLAEGTTAEAVFSVQRRKIGGYAA